MSAVLVAGIDLSLTSTGITHVRWGDPDSYGSASVCTRRIQSTGRAGESLADRQKRLHRLADQVVTETSGADLVVIEQPAFSRTTGHMHDRSGLWWIVVDLLVDAYGSNVVEVPPTARAKYATGKGNAPKDVVLAAVVRRYADVDVTGNDVADSLVLAAMGARHLGHPIETSLPATHLAAMAGVAWPTQEGHST